MSDADCKQERGDEPGPLAERLLAEGVRREDRQGAEAACAQQERDDDRLPGVREERPEEPADEEREPREQRRPWIRQGERVAQHRVRAQVLAGLEGITQGAVPIVRVGAAGYGQRVDRVAIDVRLAEDGAGDEVDAEEQGDAEDEHKDRGGPPVRAEPAFPIVQDSTNLREIAPMRERLFRHCREFSEGAVLLMGPADKRLLERPSDARARDGLKSDAHLPTRDEARPHGDPVLPRVQRGSGAPGRRRERRDPRGLPLLQALQSSVRDQGRDPGPPTPGLQVRHGTPGHTRLRGTNPCFRERRFVDSSSNLPRTFVTLNIKYGRRAWEAGGHRMTKPKREKRTENGGRGGYGVNGSRLTLRAALITATFVAGDGVLLYFVTQPSWPFVHRWVLMAAGIGSGIGWAALMMSRAKSNRRSSSGCR